MNIQIKSPTEHSFLRRAFILITLTLSCLALSPAPKAFGVVPAPDGGYPGGNTAEGENTLFSLTTGGYNTAAGFYSLASNTTGSLNTAIGAATLFANDGDQNTANGAAALLSNTTGFFNTANGAFALFSNTEGSHNTAIGDKALFSNTDGVENTAVGFGALQSSTSGPNTAVGSYALGSNVTGSGNTAVGRDALEGNTTATGNTAFGEGTLQHNSTSYGNTAVGYAALRNSNGTGNTALGAGAGDAVATASHVICIGAFMQGADVDDSCFIGSIRGRGTANNDAIPVLIDSAGQLGTVSSSRRFKREIKAMDKASEAILSLKPVTFHYKSDKTSRPEFGLIAEEVAEINPDLVVCDKDGEIYTVRYEAVNAMLLNEFLKEHQKVEELKKDFQATIAKQQKEIATLTRMVEAQAAQIEQVNAQLDVTKPPQTIASSH